MGKIITKRKIENETIRGTMGKIWCLSKLAVFKDVGNNALIIMFSIVTDKLRVLNGKP